VGGDLIEKFDPSSLRFHSLDLPTFRFGYDNMKERVTALIEVNLPFSTAGISSWNQASQKAFTYGPIIACF
jgi:hypothetical protein